jgi:hypothetical protein
MRPVPHGSLIGAALAFMIAGASAKDPGKPASPPKKTDEAPSGRDEKKPAVDKLKLPAGAVLVPYEMIKGSGQLVPMILVRPEKYREMEEQIKELARRLRPGRLAPQGCKLAGRLDGDFAVIQADLKIITDQPRTLVALGFKGALLTGDPELDGRLPVLAYSEEGGYQVQVDKEGQHHLSLQMKVPVTMRRLEALAAGVERSFELGLPGSPVTSLTIELPRSVKEVRWKGIGYPPVRPGVWEFTPGTAPLLKLIWREPLAVTGGMRMSARWETSVVIQEDQALTTARLILDDPGASRNEWRIGVPAGSDLKVLTPEGVGYVVTQANGATMVVKGPAAEHLEILVTCRHPRPFARMPVGPFVLLGADRQEGTIDIGASPEALWGQRLDYHRLLGNVRQQDVPRDQAAKLVARFQYWTGPEGGRPGGPRRPPLEIEVKPAAAQVEASVDHRLKLLRTAEETWKVDVETRIHVKPLQSGADFLDVQLPRPQPFALLAQAVLAGPAPTGLPQGLVDAAFLVSLEQLWPIQLVQDFRREGEGAISEKPVLTGQRRARFRLSWTQGQESEVILKGTYLLAGGLEQIRLPLPRPVTALDRGGVVKVEVDEGFKAVLPGEAGDHSGPDPHRLATAFERSPAFADLAWRPYRADVKVRIEADVTLFHRMGQVREELHLPIRKKSETDVGPGLRRPVRLLVPPGISKLQVLEGNKWHDRDAEVGLVRLDVAGEDLVIQYEFPLPDSQRSAKTASSPEALDSPLFQVPLLWPTEATQGLARVRFWCEPGLIPALPDQGSVREQWKDQGTEVVADRDRLPALVLEGEGLGMPLNVRLLGSSLPLTPVLVDRALMQVQVEIEGNRNYRCRFRLARLEARHLDIELPAPLARLESGLEVRLADKKCHWKELTAGGRIIRVDIPRKLGPLPVILDVSYVLSGNSSEQDGVLRTVLQPPVLGGDVFVGRVRWQVSLPTSQVGLPPLAHVAAGPKLVRRGWLFAPTSTVTGPELEEWLTGTRAGKEGDSGSLVFWGQGVESVAVIHLPQQMWLILCSGLLLLLALGLLAAPLSRAVFWLAVAALALAVVAAGFTWPAVFPVVLYGCEPGLAVLGLLVAVQWLLQRRYRRQVVFMPGFTRGRGSAALSRGSSANQRPREISTVDAPAGPGSSISRPAGSAKGSVS